MGPLESLPKGLIGTGLVEDESLSQIATPGPAVLNPADGAEADLKALEVLELSPMAPGTEMDGVNGVAAALG